MWELLTERGRHWWQYRTNSKVTPSKAAEIQQEIDAARDHYAANKSKQKHSSDEILRIMAKHRMVDRMPPLAADQKWKEEWDLKKDDNIGKVLRKAVEFYSGLQMPDGEWGGDYGGPMFLMPGLIIACYITGTKLGEHVIEEMIRYLGNHQNEDGGYGLHIEHHSTMFGTVMNYVALRLLGVGAENKVAVKARAWIKDHGGAIGTPSWGKFYLCVLGVYDYDGINPLPPEMWLMPYSIPIHPGRFWCHCRIVYLPMSHLYGKRATHPLDDLTRELRKEIYTEKYADIQWWKYRSYCCPVDEYVKRPWYQRGMWRVLAIYEKYTFPGKKYLRDWSLKETLNHIYYEDVQTKCIDIGPVNKVINFLCAWFDNPHSKVVEQHRDRVKDYLWLAEDGMKMQGYNGSQLWDTAFSVQALVACGKEIMEPYCSSLTRAHNYLEISQVLENAPDGEKFYRHISKGAWPFSTRDHGWPISDCTGEGLKATLALQGKELKYTYIGEESYISDQRLKDCVNVILSLQNKNGGWATYELTRSYAWVEVLNPSEVFGEIMIDYPYVECSSSAVSALIAFQKEDPQHRRIEILDAINRGLNAIESYQREDGSWYGSWGVCFCYGIWFGITALADAGFSYYNRRSVRKACDFLLSKQRSDGSWGESYLSSQDKTYCDAEEGQVVSTGWALLSLVKGGCPHAAALKMGAEFLMKKQKLSGDWPQQRICGVFNKNCMITYSQYRNIFPIWALAEYRALLQQEA